MAQHWQVKREGGDVAQVNQSLNNGSNPFQQLSNTEGGKFDARSGAVGKLATAWGKLSASREKAGVSRRVRVATGRGKRGGK